ncbi:MAG: 30S ribosomal protein S11 [bacterium]
MVKKKKQKKHIVKGNVYINSTFNNSIISITDEHGNVISSASAGEVGFKGTKKGTPYASQLASQSAAEKAVREFGLKSVNVIVKGPGAGRETAIRALQSVGLEIEDIIDKTPVPHNGCRPKKKRRV